MRLLLGTGKQEPARCLKLQHQSNQLAMHKSGEVHADRQRACLSTQPWFAAGEAWAARPAGMVGLASQLQAGELGHVAAAAQQMHLNLLLIGGCWAAVSNLPGCSSCKGGP